MHVHQILEELAYDTGEFPRDAIEAAILKKEEITPHLLKILEEAVCCIDEVIENDNYQGHLFAMYLLAQFRERKAFALILRLVSFPGEIPHAITGDVITEDLSRILASVAGKNTTPLKQLIENRDVNEYVRAAGQSALVTLAGCGITTRREVIAYFHTLFTEKLEKSPSFVWDNLILSSTDLYPEELHYEIVRAFEGGLIDTTFINLEYIEKVLSTPKETHLLRLYQNAELIEDTVTEMEKWLT